MSWCPDFEFRGTQVKAGLAPVIDAAVAVEAAAKAGLVAETEAAVAVGQSTDAAQRRKQAQAELTKAAKARKTHELRSASCDDLQLLTLATLGSYTEPAEEATALLDASTRLAAALLEVWHHISPPPPAAALRMPDRGQRPGTLPRRDRVQQSRAEAACRHVFCRPIPVWSRCRTLTRLIATRPRSNCCPRCSSSSALGKTPGGTGKLPAVVAVLVTR